MPIEVFSPKEPWEYQSRTKKQSKTTSSSPQVPKPTNLQPRLKPMQSIQCQKCPNILLKSCYMLQDSTCYKILQSLSKLDKRNTPVPRIPGAQSVQSQGPILLGVERGSVSPVPSCPRSLAPDRHDIGHVLTTRFCIALEPLKLSTCNFRSSL